MKPGQCGKFDLKVSPNNIDRLTDVLTIDIDNGGKIELFQLEAIGIDPELKLLTPLINFERVLLYKEVSKSFRIKNPTPLRLNYRINNILNIGEELKLAKNEGKFFN